MSRKATWTDVRLVLPFEVDRDELHDRLVELAAALSLPIAVVYGATADALAIGAKADDLVETLRIHFALEGLDR